MTRIRSRTGYVYAFGWATALTTAQAGAEAPRSAERSAAGSDVATPAYVATTAHVATDTVFALAAGELGRRAERDTLAVLVNPSDVVLLRGPEWRARTIHTSDDAIGDPENRPTLSLGDVGGGRSPELVVSANHQVTVLSPARRGWRARVIYDIEGLVANLWGARVGDFDPIRPGNEILVISEQGFDSSIADLMYRESGEWKTSTLFAGEVGMDSAAGDFDPTIAGPETAIVTEMGVSYRVHAPEQTGGVRDGSPWPRASFWSASDEPDVRPDNSGWVVKVADVDPTQPGAELVWGTRYSNRVLVFSADATGAFSYQVAIDGVFAGSEPLPGYNMWDVAVADLVPEVPGLEIAAVDGSGSVYLAWYDSGRWQQRTLWRDDAPLYAVTAGELDPGAPGLELAVGGESRAVTVLSRCSQPD